MLDLFLKLIDKLIALAKRTEEQNKASYTDFIAPTMSDFETLHRDYLDTFKHYRELIQTDPHEFNNCHPVFAAINQDNLMSEGLRAKLQELMRMPWETKGSLRTFLYDIRGYLYDIKEVHAVNDDLSTKVQPIQWQQTSQEQQQQLQTAMQQQVIRITLSNRLLNIAGMSLPNVDKIVLANSSLDDTVSQTQLAYRRVVRSHLELRKELLSPSSGWPQTKPQSSELVRNKV